MDILEKKYWELFKPDGKKFEELVGALIEHRYHKAAFVHTGRPGDGGKDFESLFELPTGRIEKLWAECKYYESNLSINDISTTLLMAFLKDVRELFIFSYSPINSNLMAHLAEYKETARVNVKVFHDKSLESWILDFCRETGRTDEFFPSFQMDNSSTSYEGGINCEYHVTCDQQYSPLLHTIEVSLSDILYIDISLFNDSNQCMALEYEFKSSETQMIKFLQPKSAERTKVQVSPHGVQRVCIPIKLTTFSSNPQFPSLYLYNDNGSEQIVIPHTKVHCRWLAEAPLCGAAAIQMVEEISKGLFKQTFSTVSLEGHSGTGKSRILQEIKKEATTQTIQTIKIDTDQESVSELVFLRQICTAIEGLPYFPSAHKKSTFLIDKDSDSGLQFAARLIYDNTFSLPEHRDEIVRYLVDALQCKPLLWLLDNVQRYDEEVIALLNGILDYCVDQPNHSKIIFTWNTDELFPESDADQMRRRLANLSTKSPQCHSRYAVPWFDNAAAIDYLQECLTYQSNGLSAEVISYEVALRSIVAHCGANPFLLQNYLLYLDQEKILRRTDSTCYYICDVERFQETLRQIPPDPFALIQKREKLFLTTFPQYADSYYALVTALVLSGSLRSTVLFAMGIPLGMINTLLDIGFLSMNQQSCVSCQHRFFRLYFQKQYPMISLSGQSIERFLIACNQVCMDREMLIPRFLAQYLCDCVDPALFSDVLAMIQSSCVPVDFGDECFQAVMKYMDKHKWYQTEPSLYAKIIATMGNTVTRRQGISAALLFFENLYETCLHHMDVFQNCFPFDFLKEYLCHLLNLGRQEESLQKNKRLAKCICSGKEKDLTQQRRFVMLLNCQVMAHYQLEHIKEANILNTTALKISRDIKDVPLTLDSLRGHGDLNYQSSCAPSHKAEIIESWRQAFSLYIDTYGSNIVSPFCDRTKISIYLKGVIAEIMAGNFSAAEKHIPFLHICFDKTNMPFYEINLRSVYAAYLVLKSPCFALDQDRKHQVMQLLDQIADLNAVYGRQITNIHAFHFRGIVHLMSGKTAFALDNYRKAAEMLSELIERPNYVLRYQPFWEDYALLLSENGLQFPSHVLSFFPTDRKKEINKIMSLSQKELITYHQKRPDPAPLCVSIGEKRWGMPILI